jgi:hypothetical protein
MKLDKEQIIDAQKGYALYGDAIGCALCDMALSALAAPVSKIEEPKAPPDGWPMHPMLRQWQQYAYSLRAALVEAERELETQRAHSIDAAFKHVDIAKRAEQAESALAAAKEKVERETIEKAANICEGMSKTVHFNEGLKAAAHAIRALKEGGAG